MSLFLTMYSEPSPSEPVTRKRIVRSVIPKRVTRQTKPIQMVETESINDEEEEAIASDPAKEPEDESEISREEEDAMPAPPGEGSCHIQCKSMFLTGCRRIKFYSLHCLVGSEQNKWVKVRFNRILANTSFYT
jgi:hypothetical protein